MSVRIGIGSGLGEPMPVDDYWRWVALCETGGIDSVWHSDQLLRPSLEPLAMLAALAAGTKRLRFGMNAVVIPHRDPLLLARQCATIDHLAPGRLLPVFGVGDAADPAWTAIGRNPNRRGECANEAIALLRRLLTEESVTFEGAHFHYHDASVRPRPQRPVPIWIGGQSEAAIHRTAALGDGWLGGLTDVATAGRVVQRIKSALKETGRQIEEDHYGVVIPFRIGAADGPEVDRFRRTVLSRRSAAGDPPTIAAGAATSVVDAIRAYVDAGVCKFVAVPIAVDPADLLDQTHRLAAEIIPKIEVR